MNYYVNKVLFLILEHKKTSAIALLAFLNFALKTAGYEIPNDVAQQLVDGVINVATVVALLMARDPNNTAQPKITVEERD